MTFEQCFKYFHNFLLYLDTNSLAYSDIYVKTFSEMLIFSAEMLKIENPLSVKIRLSLDD